MLRLAMALLGSAAEPVDGQLLVLRHRIAGVVHGADDILRVGLALLRGLQVPLEGLLVVARDAAAHVIHQAQQVLGLGIAGARQGRDLFQRLRVIARVVRARPFGETCQCRARGAETQAKRQQDRYSKFFHCLVRGSVFSPTLFAPKFAYFQLTLPSPSTLTRRLSGLP
jgi:hypothetical protein